MWALRACIDERIINVHYYYFRTLSTFIPAAMRSASFPCCLAQVWGSSTSCCCCCADGRCRVMPLRFSPCPSCCRRQRATLTCHPKTKGGSMPSYLWVSVIGRGCYECHFCCKKCFVTTNTCLFSSQSPPSTAFKQAFDWLVWITWLGGLWKRMFGFWLLLLVLFSCRFNYQISRGKNDRLLD